MADNIDYTFYASLPLLTAEVAACLWVGLDPNERYGQMPLLVKNMILIFERKIGSHVNYLGVTKKELYRLADELDVRPEFLFYNEGIL